MSLFKSIFTIPNRIVNVILRNGNVTPFSITIKEIDNDLTVENCLCGIFNVVCFIRILNPRHRTLVRQSL